MLGKTPDPKTHEIPISLRDFLDSFNKNMPAEFPQITEEQLLEFKRDHASLFKNGNLWSLDLHRKRIIDWLPQHLKKIERMS